MTTQRPKHEIEILKMLGYDPQDESYVVQMLDDDYVTVTATETSDPTEKSVTELKIAIQAAIEALQKVHDLIE